MRRLISATLVLLFATGAASRAAPATGPDQGFGALVEPKDLAKFFAIQPDGATLPPGHGSVAEGREIFSNSCAACHGDKLQGVKETGAPPLAGGRGTLTNVPPKKTVESYWPYATTLFDYIKRAMPFNAPGSLSDDQVYAVTAYILAEGKIVPGDAVMDKTTLPAVVMPNRDGFRPYEGPDHRLYR